MTDIALDGLLLRRATADDLLCLSVLAMQVFLDTYATQGIHRSIAGEVRTILSEEAFQTRLALSSVELFVAEREGALIGFLDLDHGTTCPAAGVSGLEVLRLYVQRPFQRQGLGQRFLALAEARARGAGLAAVWLTAWVGNERARAFYAACGYADVGATMYVIDGQAFENRVLVKRL